MVVCKSVSDSASLFLESSDEVTRDSELDFGVKDEIENFRHAVQVPVGVGLGANRAEILEDLEAVFGQRDKVRQTEPRRVHYSNAPSFRKRKIRD